MKSIMNKKDKKIKKDNKILKILKKEKKIILIIALSIFLLLMIFFLIKPTIKVKDKIVSIELGKNYLESGYEAKNLYKDLTNEVKVKNNININKVGEYEVTYEINYLFFNTKKVKKVKVIDKENPIITLNGNVDVLVCPNKKYEEEGYTVIDNYDKDIESKLKIETFDDKIVYYVYDSSNNKAEITRNIKYEDNEKPVINLKGNNIVYIYLNNNYNELGYTATDNCDGDITNKVSITNNIDNTKEGTYYVNYSVTDSNNNKVTVSRTIKVIKMGSGVIYLTFDDGPSSEITPQILNILKEEDVKATFFVIGSSSSLDYLIKREYDEGHKIALHSSSHNYSLIYSSVDNYFNDLYAIGNRVKAITGEEPKIIRFPGGSSNTVSRNYYNGIMTILSKEVINRGYHYFDWNVSSGDAGDASSSQAVYNNVVNGLSYNKENVVLMHDFNGNYKTLNALRNIIQYGKNNGYRFSTITMDTPMVRHRIAN